ncbi:MAG: quinolinate synthase NadA [Phycisphaerales bacterium]|nr:quinolinate synthase NadA [Phycisphaerales bacterium]
MLWQPALPLKYLDLSDDQLAEAICARRAELGEQLIILGHHYQQDDVIQHADFTGDSFKLSQLAAEKVRQAGAKYVVFCGVHFMAESADILTPDDVVVILPDLSAGCSMADMADYDQTVQAWTEIHEALDETRGPATRVIPITYMNSSAAIKAFVGEHGGAVCTSSNAARVFEWALAGGDKPLKKGEVVKILFLPDQHLGRNTAKAAGFVTEVDAAATGKKPQTALWDPKQESGGLSAQEIRDAVVLLWKGHCSVHKLYRPEHVAEMRSKHNGVTVLVHPEVCQEVVDLADLSGSTEYIIKIIDAAEPGSRWAVATETHLVNRVAEAARKRGVHVEMLSGCQCLCTTMYRIDQQHLLWVLDNLAEGKVVNQIKVHPEARKWALVALNRMLNLLGKGSVKAEPKAKKPAKRAGVEVGTLTD